MSCMERVSRRVFNLAVTTLLVAPRPSWPGSETVPKSLDRIILGCDDLDAGVDHVYRQTGVRAAAGGVHPGAGTRNALLSLGKLRYLEIIAPDPLQAASTDPRHVAGLKNPALVGWAVHRHHLKAFASLLQSEGVESVGLSARLQLDVQIRAVDDLRLAASIEGPKDTLQLHSR